MAGGQMSKSNSFAKPSALAEERAIHLMICAFTTVCLSMEPPPSPKGTINAHANINNIFLQDLHIPKRNRDLNNYCYEKKTTIC